MDKCLNIPKLTEEPSCGSVHAEKKAMLAEEALLAKQKEQEELKSQNAKSENDALIGRVLATNEIPTKTVRHVAISFMNFICELQFLRLRGTSNLIAIDKPKSLDKHKYAGQLFKMKPSKIIAQSL